MNVSDLRKAIRRLDGNMPVFIADHDHGEYEYNSIAGSAKVMNQDGKTASQEIGHEFIIEGDYLVIRP